MPERFLAGARGNDLTEILEHRRHRQQIALVIVHEEDARLLLRRAISGWSGARLHWNLSHRPVHALLRGRNRTYCHWAPGVFA